MKALYLIAIFIDFTFGFANAQTHFCDENFSYNSIYKGHIDSEKSEDSCTIETEAVEYAERIFPEDDWTIGPNPTYGPINIYGDLNNIKAIELYSITGELLQWYDGFIDFNAIDLSEHPNGIYLVRILSLSNNLKTYKLIKR